MSWRPLIIWFGFGCGLMALPACETMRGLSAPPKQEVAQAGPWWEAQSPADSARQALQAPYRSKPGTVNEGPRMPANVPVAQESGRADDPVMSPRNRPRELTIRNPQAGPVLTAEESDHGTARIPGPAPMVPMAPEGRNPVPTKPAGERLAASPKPARTPFMDVTPDQLPPPDEPKPAPAPTVDRKGPLPAIGNGEPAKVISVFPDPNAGRPTAEHTTNSKDSATFASLIESGPQEGRESALILALRKYLEGKPAEAVGQLSVYDQTRQDILLSLLSMQAGIIETSPKKIDQNQAAMILNQLISLVGRVEPLAPLTITKVHFLKDKGRFRLLDFGKFNPLPNDSEFCPGDFVWIYAEVQNYSTMRQNQDFVVHMVSSVTILDAHGHVVSTQHFPEKPDPSLSQRRDYFKVCRFTVPVPFSPGTYTLRLTVKDMLTGRQAEAKRDFFVAPSRGPFASQSGKTASTQ